jgi:hypothetical protein
VTTQRQITVFAMGLTSKRFLSGLFLSSDAAVDADLTALGEGVYGTAFPLLPSALGPSRHPSNASVALSQLPFVGHREIGGTLRQPYKALKYI